MELSDNLNLQTNTHKFNKQEWNRNNKEKIALAGRAHYQKMKSNPDFMALKRERAKLRYYKLKELEKQN